VLATSKGVALGGLLTLLVVSGLHDGAPAAHPGPEEPEVGRGSVLSAVAGQHCSHSAPGRHTVRSAALIRTTRGVVRKVSFETGWDVYTGRRPGTLVAVCIDGPSGLAQVGD